MLRPPCNKADFPSIGCETEKAVYSVLDLFSGIGNFSRGLEATGHFQTASFCEIDPFGRALLAKRWPGVVCHGDVQERQYKEGEADVIAAGFPCQDISEAGLGAGLAGARSGLWREVVRALRLVRPAVAILENVAALLHRGLDRVLGDLAEIGYDAEWHCIPVGALGAPHERDRIWIVADTGAVERGTLPLSCGRVAWKGSLQRNGAKNPGESEGPFEAAWGDNAIVVADALSRMDDGRPVRLRGFDGLANSVAPAIPEMIGRAILQARAAA